MSGSIAATLLGALTASGSGADALLGALYGLGGGTTATAAQSIAELQSAETNQTTDVAAVAAQPGTARDIAAFKAGVANATSATALLSNPAVLKVLLTANGLGDQVAYPALARKALLSDPSDPNSLADALTNTAWKSTAQTYSFATKGLSVIQQPAVLAQLANAYAEVQWRSSLDTTYPGLSNALTFRSEAATITSTDQILGDPILRDVVTTTLGLPLQIAFQSLQTQETAISSRLDITRFQDPAYVEQFAQRYLVAKQASTAATTTPDITTLATQAAGLLV